MSESTPSGAVIDLSNVWDQALQENADRLGVGSVANEEVLAHGRRQSIAVALVNCPEFANTITAMADNLPDSLPPEVKESIITGTVKDMAAKSLARPTLPEAEATQRVDRETVVADPKKKVK